MDVRTVKVATPTATADRAGNWTLVHLIAAPSLFLAVVVIPIATLEYPVRCGLGLLIWMAWWWISRPVGLAVTGFLPLATASLFNFLPVATVLRSYASELIILLLGASILTTVWTRWGLDRRIALVALLVVGTKANRQIFVWFMIAAVLTALLPNTIVASTMIPIVIAMLRSIGITELWNSRFGTAVVLAVAWGSSVSAFATPLGGAMNLLMMQFVQETVTHHEFMFMTWVVRMLPLSIAAVIITAVFLRFAFKPELDAASGTRSYLLEQLRGLGAMSRPEKWALCFFAGAALLAFTRQWYATLLPAFTPAYVFLVCGLLCFVIRHRGEPLVTWQYAQERMMWGLFYVFAGGSALGQVLSETGTAKYVADLLLPYAQEGGFIAVLVFGGITMFLTQTTSAVASIAIVVPITISTFESLGMNPIPFVYIVTAIGNCGLMLPSSAAGTAIAAGYGVNMKTMLVTGFWLSLILLGSLLVLGYLLATFYPGFGVA